MKDLIDRVINDLINLPQPYSIDSLIPVFTPIEHLFENDSDLDPLNIDLRLHDLHLIYLQLGSWKKLQGEQQVITQLEEKSKSLHIKYKQSKRKILRLNKQIESIYTETEESYHYLFSLYMNEQMAQNSLIAIANPSHMAGKIQLLLRYKKMLNDQEDVLKRNEARLELSDKLDVRTEIVAQLKELNIIVASGDKRDLGHLYSHIETLFNEQNELKHEFAKVQQELASVVSQEDVSRATIEYSKIIQEQEEQINEINEKEKEYALSVESKNVLRLAYEEAPDQKAFMQEKYEELQANISFVGTVIGWLVNENHSIQVAEDKVNYEYLKLLNDRDDCKATIAEAKKNQARVERFTQLPATTLYEEDYLLELRNQAINLLIKFDKTHTKKLLDRVGDAVLLSYIIESMSPLEQRITQTQLILKKLDNLFSIDSDISQIRTEYRFTNLTEEELSVIEVMSLRQASTKRKQSLALITQTILKINQCLERLDLINTKIHQKNELDEMLDTLKKKMALVRNNRNEFNSEEVDKNCRQVMDRITQQIVSLIKQQTANDTEENQLEIEPGSSARDKPELIIIYQDKLIAWDEKISKSNRLLSADLRQWYQALFVSLQNNVRDEKTFNQASRLLQDINTELQFPPDKDDYPVLRSYQRLCTEPDNNWRALTDMKPAMPVSQDKLLPVKNRALQEKLNKLYAKQQTMALKHPKNAELLRQATYILHQSVLIAETNPRHSSLEDLTKKMNDPRYESLHRHRGFHKTTELLAQICTFLLSFIKKQQENSYRQRFFFTPTRTSKILQETQEAVNYCIEIAG